jgi:hypothetical protein
MRNHTLAQLVEWSKTGGWVGVDLDGTLAEYNGFNGASVIGAPVPKMAERVRRWLAAGVDVRIFTARAHDPESVNAIREWCCLHFGFALLVTATKDHKTIALWDDRAVQVVLNTGERVDGQEDV